MFHSNWLDICNHASVRFSFEVFLVFPLLNFDSRPTFRLFVVVDVFVVVFCFVGGSGCVVLVLFFFLWKRISFVSLVWKWLAILSPLFCCFLAPTTTKKKRRLDERRVTNRILAAAFWEFNTTYTLHYTLPYAVCLPRNSGGGGSLVAPWCVFEWTSPPSNTIPASSSQPCPMLECFFFFVFFFFPDTRKETSRCAMLKEPTRLSCMGL